MKSWSAAILAALVVSGLCGCNASSPSPAVSPNTIAPAQPGAEHTTSVKARLDLVEPAVRRYRVQTVQRPLTKADVETIELTLLKGDVPTRQTVRIPKADFVLPVTLTGLSYGTPYTLVARAYDATGVDLTADTGNTTSFTTPSPSPDGTERQADIGSIRVPLKDIVYGGSATAGGGSSNGGPGEPFNIVDGKLVNPTDAETFKPLPIDTGAPPALDAVSLRVVTSTEPNVTTYRVRNATDKTYRFEIRSLQGQTAASGVVAPNKEVLMTIKESGQRPTRQLIINGAAVSTAN